VLSELKRKDVWEGWLGAEIRANYFADRCGHYQLQQKILTWLTLIFSSGAAVTLTTQLLPENLQWIKPTLALVAAGISFVMLLQQNQKRVTECSDLQFRWHKLGNEFKALWDDMYSQDASERLMTLEEKEAELSKSSTAIPNNPRTMLKWQDHVQQQHGFAPQT
jgi:hypothetical protein